MTSGDEDDVEMYGIVSGKHDNELQSEHLIKKNKQQTFTGLSKQELMEIEKTETHWRKIRIALFVLFWLVWLAMLIGAILIIVFTPKCPYQPILKAWEKTCLYRVNPFAFKDTNGDGVGDLEGLKKSMSYITEDLDAKTIIMDPIVKGSFGNNYLHLTEDLKSIDSRVGTNEELRGFVQRAWKSGITIIATLDLNGVGFNHPWVKDHKDYFLIASDVTSKHTPASGTATSCSSNLYTSLGAGENNTCLYLDLDFRKEAVVEDVKKVVEFWLSNIGVGGILLTNGEYLRKFDTNKNELSNATVNYLKAIRSIFDKVNAVSSRKKVLMLEAGDVPKADSRSLDVFLAKYNENVLIDVVLPSNFHYYANWDSTTAVNNFVSSYAGHDFRVGLSSATPFVQRHGSLEALVGTYLLPNLTVVYMGTELNLTAITAERPNPLRYYPQNARSLLNTELSAYTMMPWEIKGVSSFNSSVDEEYNKYIKNVKSVELLSAVGAPANAFTLSKKLMKLRQRESLLWGQIKILTNARSKDGLYQLVFTRHAQGFNPFVVIYLKSTADHKEFAVSLGDICPKGYVRIGYPTSRLTLDTLLAIPSVYLEIGEARESLTVIECVV